MCVCVCVCVQKGVGLVYMGSMQKVSKHLSLFNYNSTKPVPTSAGCQVKEMSLSYMYMTV